MPLNVPNSCSQWPRARQPIRKKWLKYLGGLPGKKCALKPKILSEERIGSLSRLKVRYQVAKGCWVEAYLVFPRAGKDKLPGIVVFHPTVSTTIDEPAGLAGAAPRHTALHLARRGYVALSPRCFIYDYKGPPAPGMDFGKGIEQLVKRMKQDHPSWVGMTNMVWDGIRAVDYLESLEIVDRQRIGCAGFSLGAKEALYLAAFDERIRACVSNEGGIGVAFSNWDAPWYLGKKIKHLTMDHHELIALIAPRAFLLVGGESQDGKKSLPFVKAVAPVYKLFNAEARLGVGFHSGGHTVFPRINRKIYGWLDRWLKGGFMLSQEAKE